MYQYHCVPVPLCTSTIVTNSRYAPISLCTCITMYQFHCVRTSTIVSHFHCVTSLLSPSPIVFQSHSQYMKPVVSQSHYIPCPLCSRYTVYQYLHVPVPLCTSTMSPNHCVPVPVCTSTIVSVPPLSTMPIVSQSHCVPVP